MCYKIGDKVRIQLNKPFEFYTQSKQDANNKILTIENIKLTSEGYQVFFFKECPGTSFLEFEFVSADSKLKRFLNEKINEKQL